MGLLLFLVLAKAYMVLVHKLRVSAWIQLLSLGVAYLVAMGSELPWIFPFSYIPGQQVRAFLHCKGGVHCPGSLMDYSPGIYILYLFIYVGTVYYGPSLVCWCSQRRHLCKKSWKNTGVRLLALLGVLVLHIDPTGMPPLAGV